MKKRFTVFVAVLALLVMSLPGLSAFAAAPSPISRENVALGKTVEFRSFDDFSVAEEMYDYWVDQAGLNGTGCRELTGNHLTDGIAGWENSTYMNAVMGVLATEANALPNVGHMAWAYVDLGASYLIDSVGIYAVDSWFFNKPVVQISADGSAWTTVFSGALALYDSEGTPIYDGGYVNLERNQGYLYDHTSVATGGYSLTNADADLGWTISFDAAQAQYVRVTGLISEHLNGGASNNTALSELKVNAITEGVAAPVASVASGSYQELEEVSLSSAYADASIYYTTDGSYPTEESALYSAPIDVSGLGEAFMIRAIAVLPDGSKSYPADYTYYVGTANVNVALGKAVEFRSFDDFSVAEEMYNYWVDQSGLNGTGCQPLTGNHMTDGLVGWDNHTYMNAVMGVGTDEADASKNGGHMAWAYIDLGSVYTIDRVGIYAVDSWFLNKPVIQISENGTEWTTVFSGVLSLYDSKGAEIYNGGYVNTEALLASGQLVDHNVLVDEYPLGGYSLTAPSADRGWTISFEKTEAQYVRVTGLYNHHVCGGASNNTAFSEITVITAQSEAVPPQAENAVVGIDAGSNAATVRYNTSKEDAAAQLAQTATITDQNGDTYTVALTWDSADYDGTVADTYTFTASYTLPDGVVNAYEVAAPVAEVTVAAQADTAALEAKIAEAVQLKQEDYMSAGWQVFAEALSEAQTVAENLQAYQSEVDAALASLEEAMAGLEEKGDASELSAAVEQARQLQGSEYTASSFAAFSEELSAAEALLEGEYSQAEYDDAKAELEAAIAALVERADKAAFEAQISEYKDKTYEGYTASTVAALNSAIANAEDYLADTAAEELAKDTVDSLVQAMAAAHDALVALGDKTALNAVIAEAEALAEADYTASTYAALESALAEAKTCAASNDVDQAAVDAAKTALDAAVNALVSVKDLRAAVAEAEAKEQNSYTSVTWEAFRVALESAKSVLADADATAEEIQTAAEGLAAATEALAAKGDKTALQSLVAECEALKEEDYSGGWAAFESALADARAVLDDGDAVQTAIDAAKTALESAREALTAAGETGEGDGSSCSSSVAAPVAVLCIAALVLGIVLLKKKSV